MNFGLSNLSLSSPSNNQVPQIPPNAPRNGSTFGVLIPGRPLLWEWAEIDSTHLVAEVPLPAKVTDLSFFMLPGASLPPGSGAAIHFSLPPYDNWTILGAIHVNSPSNTFRTGWQNPLIANAPSVRLGISLEAMDTIHNLEESKSISTINDRADWGRKLATDLYNYMGSYSQTTVSGEQIIAPTNVLDKWMAHFESKYMKDPNFVLKSD